MSSNLTLSATSVLKTHATGIVLIRVNKHTLPSISALGGSLPLGDLTDSKAVISAIRECDQLGREAFLRKYGFGEAKEYFLKYRGQLYDSKAIAGVAFGIQFPNKGPLSASEFSGGDSTVSAKLQELGFSIERIPNAGSFVILAENDESQWKDETGSRYHFPVRYLKYLKPGTRAIFYKGKLRKAEFKNRRLHKDAHYFGVATIGLSVPDANSDKNDHYCELLNFKPFSIPVLAYQDGRFIESIPAARATNYWRDGVRPVKKEIFDRIIGLSDFSQSAQSESDLADLYQGLESSLESAKEGRRREVLTSHYERNPKIRQRALLIHGYRCQTCDFNFEEFYGPHGQGFIHVHHLRPLSEIDEEHEPDPRTDFAVLCANCHAMIHRRRSKTLTIDELRIYIERHKKSQNKRSD